MHCNSRSIAWYLQQPETGATPNSHWAFLRNIGYLDPEGPDFKINNGEVDAEICTIAGPQLVVPADKRQVRHQRR